MLFTDAGISADVSVQNLITSIRIEEWLREDLFYPRWWFLLGLFIISTLIWCKMADKSRLPEIVLFAGITVTITLVLDEIGEELTIWDYPTDIFPIFPPLTAINLASLPFIYSLIYQHFKTWKTFLLAAIVMSAIFSFVCEPILVWADIYQLLKWKYYYGFPFYILMALFIRWMVITIYTIQEKALKKAGPGKL